ncbi:hypothetical protein [Mycobacterium camsae]|uniref:hypothetical protein n=1 Tax=Mycobacterium gordonae TaxID=1778 RepID=UPI001F11FA67|nr:hypothetical protein [Mycobacterium gordonae]
MSVRTSPVSPAHRSSILVPMNAAEAVAAVTEHIRRAGIDYPTTGLTADRFEAGWSVYAPVNVDTGDPAAFLDMPVGRAVFLIGDSGRIEEASTSTPPRIAQQQFAEHERVAHSAAAEVDSGPLLAELADSFDRASKGRQVATGYTVLDGPAPDADLARHDEQISERASAMLDPIAREVALLGPPGWQEFSAVFALTIRAGSADCAFATRAGWQPVHVPRSVMDLVRTQREVSAQMSAGPWWRLMLTVNNQGQLRADYDYGEQPFPAGQLQPAQNYRDDIAAFPRPLVPVWLAGYLAGPAAQGRTPAQASAAAAADASIGRHPTETDDIEPLPETWSRWATLAAIYIGAHSVWGPRISPGLASYESDARSGSSLFVLPGNRAVLSGGRWNSPLLIAAYHQRAGLPDLYCGAPAWVNDSALNTRNQNGLLSFCYWWDGKRWCRGATDTFDELDDPLPAIWTPEETVAAMTTVLGPGLEDACHHLLAAAARRTVTPADLAAVFTHFPDPDLGNGFDQLRQAGLTR